MMEALPAGITTPISLYFLMPKNYLEFLTKSVEYGILQIVNKSGQNMAKNRKNTQKEGLS